MKTFLCVAAASVVLAMMLGLGKKKGSPEGHAYLELTLENHSGDEINQTAIVLDTNRCTSGIRFPVTNDGIGKEEVIETFEKHNIF